MLESTTPPTLLTVQDIATTFHFSKFTARKFIYKQLVPLGGVVRVGSRTMVSAATVNKWIRANSLTEESIEVLKKRRAYSIEDAKSALALKRMAKDGPTQGS